MKNFIKREREYNPMSYNMYNRFSSRQNYKQHHVLKKQEEAEEKVEIIKKILATRLLGSEERFSDITWVGVSNFRGKTIIYLNPLENVIENEMQLEIATSILGSISGYQYDMMGAFYYWFMDQDML